MAQNHDRIYNPIKAKDPVETNLKDKGIQEENSVELKPKLSLLNGCNIIIGSIIGSGIFVTPSGVLQNAGSVNMSLLVWVFSGVFSMVGAYCYAELGCMIRKSGGDYAYIMDTFGNFLGFIRLWVECMIVRPCTQAVVALSFAVYASKPFFPECEPPAETVRLLAAVCICLLAFINCWEMKWATTVQDLFTYAKLFALFVIILTGLVQLAKGNTTNFTWDDTETDITKISLSFYSGLFAYFGWNNLNFIIEELQDPVRNLPKAIGISCVLVTLVYTMANVAFYTTLSVPQVLSSEAVAITFAKPVYGPAAFLMPIFVALSTFGGVNGLLMTSSRLFYAGAVQGQMPSVLSMIQVKKLTPVPSVLVVAFLSLLYLLSSDIFTLINYLGFATTVSIGMAVICVPWLRYTHPEWNRPVKVNLIFPLIYILFTIFMTIIPLIARPMETGMGLVLIFTSIPVYFVTIVWKNKPVFVGKIGESLTLAVQRTLLVVPPKQQ